MGRSIPVKLSNGRSWPAKKEAEAHFRVMLNRYGDGDRVNDQQDHSDLEALVTVYDSVLGPEEPTKTGAGVDHFDKGPDPVKRPIATSCFFVVRKDGSRIDFSVYDAIDVAASIT